MTTFNPSDKSANCTLSNGNLTAAMTSVTAGGAKATASKSAGKWYFEITPQATTGSFSFVGACTAAAVYASMISNGALAVGVFNTGTIAGSIYINGINAGRGLNATWVGTAFPVALDMDNARCWIRNGPAGSWNAISGSLYDPTVPSSGISISALTGGMFPMFVASVSGASALVNFGASPFAGGVPAGFAGIDLLVASPVQARAMVLA